MQRTLSMQACGGSYALPHVTSWKCSLSLEQGGLTAAKSEPLSMAAPCPIARAFGFR
jgi:hypothetical protein